MARNTIVGLGLVVVVVSLLASALTGQISAQQPTAAATGTSPSPAATATPIPTPTPTAYPLRQLQFNLLAQANIRVTTAGPSTVSAATLAMTPGSATLPFVTAGATVIAVQSGAVSIDADSGVVQIPDLGPVIGLDLASGTPGPLRSAAVSTNQQVLLAAGATATIRNDGGVAASILILTVVPAAHPGAVATPTP